MSKFSELAGKILRTTNIDFAQTAENLYAISLQILRSIFDRPLYSLDNHLLTRNVTLSQRLESATVEVIGALKKK